jgi:hypothetical protein
MRVWNDLRQLNNRGDNARLRTLLDATQVANDTSGAAFVAHRAVQGPTASSSLFPRILPPDEQLEAQSFSHVA